MKKKLYRMICLCSLISVIMCGCRNSTNETEYSYEEFDVEYTTNDDGTYTCKDNLYQYKIEVSGMEGESEVTFIILTNDAETSFEDITYSLKKAELTTGVPEFVILGWYSEQT